MNVRHGGKWLQNNLRNDPCPLVLYNLCEAKNMPQILPMHTEALSTYHSTIHKKNSTQVAKHIRLSIICWGYQNSYMKPRDPQFKNLSPLTPIHRHPKCPCPKQNSLFICKIPSVLSLPTSAESIPIYLAVQSRNHKNLNSCFSSTWQC